MKRLPALTALLIMTFLLAACGGGGQSGQAPDPEESQTEPATEESVADTTQEEGAPPEGTVPESTTPESAAPDDEQEGQDEAPGYSATTLDGEQVSLGGGGDVTALFFMAGW